MSEADSTTNKQSIQCAPTDAIISADLDQKQSIIKDEFANTNSKIESVNKIISEIKSDVDGHGARISQLESYTTADNHRFDAISLQIEILKQDRLRNNLRLTGLPPVAFDNTINTVMKIIDVLKLELLPSDFVAYSDRNQASIILTFDHQAHKRLFMSALRQRNELLVEEIFTSIRSNSKIYCIDQLTPYFASLFQKAWDAKKQKLIYSASSLGDRIKIRKT